MTKLILALLAGAVLALAVVGVRNRHRFRYRPVPLTEGEYQAVATAEGFRAEEVEVAPGVRLRGLVRPPRDAEAPWLLFLPGNGSDVLSGARALLRRVAGEVDLGLAAWAYRGFDGSTGTPDARALFADSDRLVAHLQNAHGVAPSRLHVMSFSLGTALALRLAAELEARGWPPASLVLLSPYDRLHVTQDAWWAPWSFADEYDALLHAGASRVPALLVHGTADDAVPVTAGRALARAMGSRAELVELPGRGHADWLGDDAALAKVREFLEARASR